MPILQRGNIGYDQIRSAARKGLGKLFQMFGGGATRLGDAAVYDGDGNVVDGGGAPVISGGGSGGTVIGGSWYGQVPNGVVDGVNKVFTLDYYPADPFEIFNVNVPQVKPKGRYTISGYTITMDVAPKPTDDIYIWYHIGAAVGTGTIPVPPVAPPPPPPPPITPVGSPTTATLTLWCAFYSGNGTALGGTPGIQLSYDGGATGWNYFGNVVPFPAQPFSLQKVTYLIPTIPTDLTTFQIVAKCDGTLAVSGCRDEFHIYDIWIDFTYSNGATERIKPTSHSLVDSGTGGLVSPALMYDTDADPPVSQGYVYRSHYSSLGDPDYLWLTGWSVVGSTDPVAPPPAPPTTSGSGSALLFLKTGPSTDPYTSNPSVAQKAFLNANVYRLMAYEGYWDSRLSWYPNAWVYRDASSLYTDDPAPASSWILHNAGGGAMYLTWGCAPGECPQYAPNYSSSAFRAWWITEATAWLAAGYKGLFIDDVNMPLSLSDSWSITTPIDPNTNAPMTQANWELYLVEFLEAVRAAFPAKEIAHNALWYTNGGDVSGDSLFQRQIQAADWYNEERGDDDGGITGGTGTFSLTNKLNMGDGVHGLSRNIIEQNLGVNPTNYYPLACYFLNATGTDMFCPGFSTPPDWPTIDYVALGAASGARYRDASGLFRRDFANGIVLVNDPGASTKTITLSNPYTNPAGQLVSTVSLGGRQGMILRA
jgi:hypothetical protein